MNLVALASFISVAGHGGFRQASRATGQPQATLSRHVRALENSLGVRLVERGRRALCLTEEGRVLEARTVGLLAELDEAGQSLSGGLLHPRGRLRVSATVSFAHMAMGRIATAFVAQYPDVVLEVVGEDRFVDLVAERFDAVIRIDPRPEHNLVGHCILRDRMLVVVPASLAPAPSECRLGRRPVLPAVMLSGSSEDTTWQATQDGTTTAIHVKPVLRLSSPLMIRDAVRAGAGAALLPRSMVAEDLDAGQLISLGAVSNSEVKVWVMHSSRRLVSPKLAAFVRHMRIAFTNGADLSKRLPGGHNPEPGRRSEWPCRSVETR